LISSPGNNVEFVQFTARSQTGITGVTYTGVNGTITVGSLTFDYFAVGY